MKKQLLAALLALPVLAAAQTPFTYTIKGKVGRLSAPAKIYLVRGLQPLDSATLKNGEFTIRGTAEAPVAAQLVVRRQGRLGSMFGRISNRASIFVEPGTLLVTSPDSLENAAFKGGPVMTDHLRLQAAVAPIGARMVATTAQAQKATEAQRNDPAFSQRIQAQLAALDKDMLQANYAFVRANPHSWVSLDALHGMRMWDPPQYATVAPLYEALSPELKASPAGRDLRS
ncbi:DUF4369 domain-containing protein [Hymenobacter sp. ASUV-10]|uniref:DUF4369 domain-containing protein n=1 Tax=Hymenobacter aranciens TaxID=3063996 RepID=A0ABT9B8I6_9BACT|nr:DUF4369 domain-containing protein [Hymenobacter sp. ASUV-10]MDO7873968.1 DUF4369 domain-containing protein [Hymenobacter sp. ASUV-10]